MTSNYSDLPPRVAEALERYEDNLYLWLIGRVRKQVWDRLWSDKHSSENNSDEPESTSDALYNISDLELSDDTQICLSQADWETNSIDLSHIDTLWKLILEMRNQEIMQWWHFFSWLYVEFPWYTSKRRMLLRWPKSFKIAWKNSQANLWQYVMNEYKNL